MDAIYKLLRAAPHVARNAIREPWVDSPEYKAFLLNKLKIAQIEAQNFELEKGFK